MRIIGVIEGQSIIELEDLSVVFIADADIDCDGGPNTYNDPCWQPTTSLMHNGEYINSEVVPGMVVPPMITQGVVGVVMGCKCRVMYRGPDNIIRIEDGVVFDSGPPEKIGEISVAMAERLKMNPNPNYGGEDSQVVGYRLWPGIPAVVDGIVYDLQPS